MINLERLITTLLLFGAVVFGCAFAFSTYRLIVDLLR